MSTFDLDSFMSQPADAGSTTIEPIPQGEYTALIDDVKLREVNTRNGPSLALDVDFLIQDEALKQKLGRQELKVKGGFFLDLNAGKLDMAKGKNVRLNRLREAVGQNSSGWTPAKLKGAGPLKIQVSHRVDGDVVYTDVKSYGKMK